MCPQDFSWPNNILLPLPINLILKMDPDKILASPVAFSVSPKIFQLSPLPGHIYVIDRFYYAHLAGITQGVFTTLLAFAAVHGHPVTVHDCPDIAAFQP